MTKTEIAQQLGKYLDSMFNQQLIVCAIYGKRWAYEWSNINDIENSVRHNISEHYGLILPADVENEISIKIINAAGEKLNELKTTL